MNLENHPSQRLKWAFLIEMSVVIVVVNFSHFRLLSPKPLDQNKPNLAQNILLCRVFTFIQIKDHALFQGKVITKLRKYIDKIFLSETTGPYSSKLGYKANWPLNSRKDIFLYQSRLWYNLSFVEMCVLIGTVTQVNNVAHGSLVYIIGQRYNVKI